MTRIYTRRKTVQKQQTGAPVVKKGDLDPMSRARREMNVPNCPRTRDFLTCTRAVGHAEGGTYAMDSNHAFHVACGPDDRALAVWR